ncbi:hypothetical protein HDV00_000708 [Rhizophlyctis rosea]|nr:hypothetical protein HDV00_000708 [Rhizophlyctis rosea]
MQHHPDRQHNKPETERSSCADSFVLIQQAYDILSNEDSRKIYDQGQTNGSVDGSAAPWGGNAAAWQEYANAAEGRPPDPDEPKSNLPGFLAPVVMSMGAVLVVTIIMFKRIQKSRQREEWEAWERFAQAREKDGLAEGNATSPSAPGLKPVRDRRPIM